MNDHLVFLEYIDTSQNFYVVQLFFCLYVVISSICFMYPISMVCGCMQETILFEITVFWPKLRKDVRDLIKIYAHCNLPNRWWRRSSELIISWPINFPFFILYTNFWCPDDSMNYEESTICLTQCVILLNFLLLCIFMGVHLPPLINTSYKMCLWSSVYAI